MPAKGETSGTVRKLPTDPKEFEEAIAPAKVMVRPLIQGVSRICKTLGTDELDKNEIESGSVAWGALMYQYGAVFDAKVLVAIWSFSIALPRVTQYLENREKRRAESARPVSGEVMREAA